MTGVRESVPGNTKDPEKKKEEKQGKGKGKTSDGKPFCFSWGRCRDGPCKDPPPGSECPNKREHKCEFCESAEHRSKDCPKKPDWVKW